MIVAAGWPSIYEDRLEALFASSPTLQAAVNKPAELVREEHIFNDYAWYEQTDDGVLKAMRPLIVFREQELVLQRDTFTAAGGQGNLWSGSTGVLITDNARHQGSTDPIDHKRSKRVFVNFVGELLADIEAVAGIDVNIGFASAEMVLPYTRTPITERTEDNDIWEFGIAFRFGLEP